MVEEDIARERVMKGRITKENAAKEKNGGVNAAEIALTWLHIVRKNLVYSMITYEVKRRIDKCFEF